MGIPNTEETCANHVRIWQEHIRTGNASYNDAVEKLYGHASPWAQATLWQEASLDNLKAQHVINEGSVHRVVGLVVETRPNTITGDTLTLLRQLGCTKLQMGVQTLNEAVAKRCARPTPLPQVYAAFEIMRAFGFKNHAHFMANLPGAHAQGDKTDYEAFVTSPAIAPDEVKLYPYVLLADTVLEALYQNEQWKPHPEEVLVDILAHDILVTPTHTRISRMIRDFSSNDIVAGNKKTNLRQIVEARVVGHVQNGAAPVHEIRVRKIATSTTEVAELTLQEERYKRINVISAIGTRNYYRAPGILNNGLYLTHPQTEMIKCTRYILSFISGFANWLKVSEIITTCVSSRSASRNSLAPGRGSIAAITS